MPPKGVFTIPRGQVRRKRPASSCEPCRRRKVRCNQGLPCKACIQSRSTQYCVYRDVHGVRSPSIADSSNDVESYSGTKTELARHSNIRADPSPSEYQSVDTNIALSGTSPVQPALSGISVSPLDPRLRQFPDKAKIFGQSHWVQIAEQFPVLRKFDAVEDRHEFMEAKAELNDQFKEIASRRLFLKSRTQLRVPCPTPDLFGTFPPKGICDKLVNGYLRTLEPIYRILHIPSFLEGYQNLWQYGPPEHHSHKTITPLCLVLAIGTTFHDPIDNKERDRLRCLAQTWIQSVQAWLASSCEKMGHTIEGLQIICLLLLARHSTFNGAGTSALFSAGSLLSTATTMGLQRDSSMFRKLTPFQRETRSRLWTTVLELAVQISADQALPLNLTPDDFDAPLPLNINDSDLRPDDQTMPDPRVGRTDSSLQVLLAELLPLRLRVLRLANVFNSCHTYDDVLKLDAELKTASRRLSSFFRTEVTTGTEGDSSLALEIGEFHSKLLDINLRRFVLLLHRPFLIRAKEHAQFYLSRKACAEASMVILSHSTGTDMSAPLLQLDDFARLSLYGRGLFKGSFSLDPILVLALEVTTQLGKESVLQSEADALDDLAKASRAPMISTLDRIDLQLEQMLCNANDSYKRHLFLRAYISQIHAMEACIPVHAAVIEALTSASKKCVALLQSRSAEVSSEGLFEMQSQEQALSTLELPTIADYTMMDSWNVASFFSFAMDDNMDFRCV